MRKINIFNLKYWIILLFLTLGSCQEVLDVVPTDRLDIDRILTKQGNIVEFRNNCYDQLNGSMISQSAGQLLDVFTDDAFRAGTGSYYDWHNDLLTPINNIMAGTIWNTNWQGIRKCNLAFEYMPQSKVSKESVTDEQIAQWLAEVKVLRAWYHFILVKNFGPVPFIDKPFDVDFTGWNELKRPSYDEISTRIVKELDEVIAGGLLPLRWQSSGDYIRMNLAVAYALKSQVLLYNASLLNNPANDQAKWQKAATAAQECLTALGSEYSLQPVATYDNLFGEAVTVLNKEIILRANENSTATTNNNNGVDLKALGSTTQSNNCGAVPTQELVDCFELTDGTLPVSTYNADHTTATFGGLYTENAGTNPYVGRDLRLKSAIVFNTAKYGKYKGQAAAAPELVIFTYLGKVGTGFNINTTSQLETDKRLSCTGYYLKKYNSSSYWGSTAGGTFSHKVLFRLAEVYLNLAEANCELNKLDEAIVALDMIRVRAGQPKISLVPGFAKTKDFLMKRIRNERRVELCFEGHRFYDQRRWKILDQTNGVISGMKITSAGTTNKDLGPFAYERVKIETVRNATSDKYLVLPIPQDEARKLTGLGQPAAWQ
jgi:hypothetical protein